MTVTTKRQVVLPKTMCERKRIRPGTSLRVTEVGDGFYVTPAPEPTEAELAAVFKALDLGRRTRSSGRFGVPPLGGSDALAA
jgi:AbrB family looped-hinge helix DNA binding protein